MSRPCVRLHPEISPESCSYCQAYVTNPVWRERWGGAENDLAQGEAYSHAAVSSRQSEKPVREMIHLARTKCGHRGTDSIGRCGHCGGEEMFTCSVFGECTKTKCMACDQHTEKRNPSSGGESSRIQIEPRRTPPLPPRERGLDPSAAHVRQEPSRLASTIERFIAISHRPASPGASSGSTRLEWISTAQLVRDAITLGSLLPPDVGAIAGVPRSGMLPATVLATHLHLPLYQLTESGKLEELGHGSRGRNYGFAGGRGAKPKRFCVVDDTVYSGAAMSKIRASLRRQLKPGGEMAILACVYARPEASGFVDVFARPLPSPHLLEWNVFNNGTMTGGAANQIYRGGVATDFDGVLCADPIVPDADGGPELETYRQWMINARPLLLPRVIQIPLIVTARLEIFRQETEDWLRRWGAKWKKLVMHPAKKASERGDVAKWKAEEYQKSNCGFYIESDAGQAERIWKLGGKPVICHAAGKVFH